MKNLKTKNIVKKTLLFSLLLVATFAMSIPVLAVCGTDPENPENYRRSIVTYYHLEYPAILTFDSRCSYYTNSDGQRLCRIRMRGILYRPFASAYERPRGEPAAQFPAIIVNHGSGAEFEADNRYCEIANWFVPKGYIVFAPFRRGQGDNDAPLPTDPNNISDKSTGVYIDDMKADFGSSNPIYPHLTNCATSGCYHAELFQQQAEVEVADYAINYLKNRTDVKDNAIAIMGSSYGGAVTVLANKIDAGQNVAVAFSPAAQLWNPTTCAPNDITCPFPVQAAVLSAAAHAKKPAFYLQAKWDYDTRATIDLAYAHAYGSSDPTHGKRFMASIFRYPKPGIDPDTGELDYQSVHTGFFNNPNRWGKEVLEFMRTYGVE